MRPELLHLQKSFCSEEMKAYYARMFKQGYPLILHPQIVDDVESLGWEEGVHFIVQKST